MTDQAADATGAPAARPASLGIVPFFNMFARRLLRAGTPMGPNALVTIRGRTSGLPRTTPLAIVEHAGRRWIWAPFGEVDWVRNLRAAGEATITVGRRTEEVTAIELDPAERVVFFERRPDAGRPIHAARRLVHPHRAPDRPRRPGDRVRGTPGVRAASPSVTHLLAKDAVPSLLQP